MAWYRFPEAIKQVNYIDFVGGMQVVCDHLRGYPDVTQPRGHVEIVDVRLRSGKLAFDTSAPIPAGETPHLGLEAG